jgi:hypothetical protein
VQIPALAGEQGAERFELVVVLNEDFIKLPVGNPVGGLAIV